MRHRGGRPHLEYVGRGPTAHTRLPIHLLAANLRLDTTHQGIYDSRIIRWFVGVKLAGPAFEFSDPPRSSWHCLRRMKKNVLIQASVVVAGRERVSCVLERVSCPALCVVVHSSNSARPSSDVFHICLAAAAEEASQQLTWRVKVSKCSPHPTGLRHLMNI